MTLDDIDLAALVRILLARWKLILICTVIGTSIGLGYALTAPKTWRSTSRVLVDPRDKQVVGQGITLPTQGTDPAWVATQASLVTSEATLGRVFDTLDLGKNPAFAGDRETALRKLGELILVERADESYVLDVSVTSNDPTLSTRIAGALGEAFVASLVDAKADAIRQATQLLGRQIDDLRDKAREAEIALQKYRTDNNLVSASGRSVDEERLRQLNEAYVTAGVRAQEAKARRDRLAGAVRRGGAEVDSALQSVDSGVLSRLKIEYALAERSIAEMARELGPSHPRLQAAEANAARTRSLIVDELRSLAATASSDYDQAAAAEAAAKASLEGATDLVNRNGVAGIRLRELENEAKVRQDMYASFVSRMEQTALQTGTQISDARVIVPAQMPIRPYTPKRTLAVMLGFVAGFGIGLTGALYRGRVDLVARPARTVPAAADEAEPVAETRPARQAAPQAPARPAPEAPSATTEAAPKRRRKPLAEIFDSLREDAVEPVPPAVAPAVSTAPAVAVESPPAAAPARPGLFAGLFRRRHPAAAAVEPTPAPARVAPAPLPEPREDAEVLAEFVVDTRPALPGRSGRPLVRARRDVYASALADAGGAEAARDLAARLAEGRDHGVVTVVFGSDCGDAASAVAFAIAAGAVAAGRRALLVDAAGGAVATALTGAAAPDLIDVLDGRAGWDDVALRVSDGFDVVPAGPLADLVADRAAIGELVEAVAESYDHVVVDLGSEPDLDLVQALADAADGAVLAIAAAAEADPDAVALVDDLAVLTPGFAGLVLVDDRAAAAAAGRASEAA
ncbi:exopolysaccharide transport family protein [Oharaeibacter diazotrophicus]|uniref:exopolysaccharide transport family protein n=2 Tax=Oharaeibacter diazotrophicus TaxID=1920512 RepID=UPI001414EFB5|nr:exopolysaccharide transport family protein [Oharaeibacter diazotrophicus]